jgi:hypothetical protein
VTTENTPYPTTRSARLVRALAIIVLVVLTAVLLGQIASAEDTTSSAGH